MNVHKFTAPGVGAAVGANVLKKVVGPDDGAVVSSEDEGALVGRGHELAVGCGDGTSMGAIVGLSVGSRNPVSKRMKVYVVGFVHDPRSTVAPRRSAIDVLFISLPPRTTSSSSVDAAEKSQAMYFAKETPLAWSSSHMMSSTTSNVTRTVGAPANDRHRRFLSDASTNSVIGT